MTEDTDGMAALTLESKHIEAITEIINGNLKPMAELVRTGAPISPRCRWYLANFLEGKITIPDKRGKANKHLSLKDSNRLDDFLSEINSTAAVAMVCVDILADRMGMEPKDLRALIEKRKSEDVARVAQNFDLKINTIRQYRSVRKDAAWAEVFIGLRQLQVRDTNIKFDLIQKNERKSIVEMNLDISLLWLNNPGWIFNEPLKNV